MLTDRQIRNYLHEEKIKIAPFEKNRIKDNSYILRLGLTLLVPFRGQIFDIKKSDNQPKYSMVKIDEHEGYLFNPQEIIIGQTKEKIITNPDINVYIDQESCLGGLGIFLKKISNANLPFYDENTIAFEIYNAGRFKVKLYPNIDFGKLVFFQSSDLSQISYEDYSKFAGKSEIKG